MTETHAKQQQVTLAERITNITNSMDGRTNSFNLCSADRITPEKFADVIELFSKSAVIEEVKRLEVKYRIQLDRIFLTETERHHPEQTVFSMVVAECESRSDYDTMRGLFGLYADRAHEDEILSKIMSPLAYYGDKMLRVDVNEATATSVHSALKIHVAGFARQAQRSQGISIRP